MKTKTIVRTAGAPAPVGPYSQAVRAGGFLFCAGQIPLDPGTGDLVAGGIAAQTERVLKNLEAILAQEGLGFSDVVKTTVFMVDLGEFAAMNEVYGRFFIQDPPARSTIQVVALPRGSRVEIELVAAAASRG
ncbi:MAG TPA: RidA family protein [Verrucomicrobiota bacterium]|nr:RidA family protein [Verrucomicrobiota bacterium]HNU53061.1 RidA family protein [Verrucomicrobiota bacterium]